MLPSNERARKTGSRVPIKVGILISYDYHFVFDCIRQVYSEADQIFLAIDRERLTWNGQSFVLPDGFSAEVRALDHEGKIRFFEGSFYLPGLTPIECDTRERNLLAQHMGYDGWHIQVDSDEYFVDFPGFVNFLRNLTACSNGRRYSIYARWFTLFRKTQRGYLHVKDSHEEFPLATNDPRYVRARITNNSRSIRLYTDFLVVHESWARSDEEILKKLKNWGHSDDFVVEEYFQFWKGLDEVGFEAVVDFHPIRPKTWKSLGLVEGAIPEILRELRAQVADQKGWQSHIVKEIRPATWWRRLKEWTKKALR